MAMRIAPITAQLGRLLMGRLLIGSTTATTPFSRTSIRHNSIPTNKEKEKGERIEPPGFASGLGEKIYIWNHILDGMTAYSHSPVLKSGRALKQIPFNGKKMKPSKLRKDYWRPLAMIQFAEGQGEVGRSVFLHLRECKKLHEYSWDDSLLFGENGRTRTKRERGICLNDQRANTIADMAAVLGGLGKGNLIAPKGAKKELVEATVWWADALDRNHAIKWTKNVTHELFSEATLERITPKEKGEKESKGSSTKRANCLVTEQELTKDAEPARVSHQRP
ncbi:hypothetical protein F5Y09DRAFT_328568 [Xylaria sp. FL1042]|nr:hypothetical protein F5Y09DRAFT_328568 [Xylaria sp. FL1042]